MKLHQSAIAPVTSPLGSPAGRVPAFMVLGLVAILAAAIWATGFKTSQDEKSPAVMPGAETRNDGPDADRTAPEQSGDASPSVSSRTSFDQSSAREESEKTRSTESAEALVAKLAQSRAAARVHGDPRMERMLGLMPGNDEYARIALAKDILAERGLAPLKSRAMQVLFELEPRAAKAELMAIVASEADNPSAGEFAASAIQFAARQSGALSDADLSSLFKLGGQEAKLAAASALENRGDESLTGLIEQSLAKDLGSGDFKARVAALESLASLNSENVTALTLPLLSDENECVRFGALQTLREQGPDEATLNSIRALADDSSENVSELAKRIVRSMERRIAERDE